jgi:hypothetical protein
LAVVELPFLASLGNVSLRCLCALMSFIHHYTGSNYTSLWQRWPTAGVGDPSGWAQGGCTVKDCYQS